MVFDASLLFGSFIYFRVFWELLLSILYDMGARLCWVVDSLFMQFGCYGGCFALSSVVMGLVGFVGIVSVCCVFYM